MNGKVVEQFISIQNGRKAVSFIQYIAVPV